MKIAILSVTNKGKVISDNLKEILDKDPTIIRADTFHKNIKENINNIFNKQNISYDAIIGIMATGIIIRSIAPYIQSKIRDPAVIAMDENGKYAISLVSGHLGRANELTEKIAKLINSEPVITTATDVNNKIGIDTLANKYYWEIINKDEILYFNKSILEDKKVYLFVNIKSKKKINYIDDINNYLKSKNHNTVEIIDLKNEEPSIKNTHSEVSSVDINAIINIANKNYDIVAICGKERMIFRERNLVVGIGAKSNISKEKVVNAINEGLNNLNLPIERINSLATAEIKAEEVGILESAEKLKLPLKIINLDEIKKLKDFDISHSKFVEEKFGIIGVCEPAALIGACGEENLKSRLIHKKTAIDGVTVAVAISI